MSGSAGLAAARRRRGIIPETKPNTLIPEKNPQILEPRGPVSIGGLLMEHDKKLFDIEKKISMIEPNFRSNNSLDIENLKESITKQTMEIYTDNKKNIEQLNRSKYNIDKQLEKMNTLVLTLQASLLQQKQETDFFKSEFEKLSDDLKNLNSKYNDLVKTTDTTDSQETQDVQESEETQEAKESQEVQESEETQEVQESQEVQETQESQEVAEEKTLDKKGRQKKGKGIKLDIDSDPKV